MSRPASCATPAPSNAYFQLRRRHGRARIRSRRRAGGRGELRLCAAQAARFFEALRRDSARPLPYHAWADTPWPTADFALVRLDASHGRHAGQLLVVACAPPSEGELALGRPAQEATQLTALLGLEAIVATLLAQGGPTMGERALAAGRARHIRARSVLKLLPQDGYCPRCGADVTPMLAAPTPEPSSCPQCQASWCD